MFDLTFHQNGAVILVFRFDENTGSPPVLIEGDDSWFDYNFQPPDPTGNPVSIYSDPDAYASAIAAVYSSNGIIVDVQKTGGLPPEPPSDFAVPVSRSVGTIELDEDKELSGWWRRFWALFIDGIIISLIIGALGAAVIGIIPGGASVETKNTTTITGPDQSVPTEQTLPQGTQMPQYTTGDTGETGDTGQTDYNQKIS